jgi:hypothetical protein
MAKAFVFCFWLVENLILQAETGGLKGKSQVLHSPSLVIQSRLTFPKVTAPESLIDWKQEGLNSQGLPSSSRPLATTLKYRIS